MLMYIRVRNVGSERPYLKTANSTVKITGFNLLICTEFFKFLALRVIQQLHPKMESISKN